MFVICALMLFFNYIKKVTVGAFDSLISMTLLQPLVIADIV